MNFTDFKKLIDRIIDLLLGIACLFIIIYMFRYLVDVGYLLFQPISTDTFAIIIQEMTAFFMLFEFALMLVRYIQDGHHIPIRYLILISMTAILRQLLVIHDNGMQTLLLSFAILLLSIVLFILSLSGESFYTPRKEKDDHLDKQF